MLRFFPLGSGDWSEQKKIRELFKNDLVCSIDFIEAEIKNIFVRVPSPKYTSVSKSVFSAVLVAETSKTGMLLGLIA